MFPLLFKKTVVKRRRPKSPTNKASLAHRHLSTPLTSLSTRSTPSSSSSTRWVLSKDSASMISSLEAECLSLHHQSRSKKPRSKKLGKSSIFTRVLQRFRIAGYPFHHCKSQAATINPSPQTTWIAFQSRRKTFQVLPMQALLKALSMTRWQIKTVIEPFQRKTKKTRSMILTMTVPRKSLWRFKTRMLGAES